MGRDARNLLPSTTSPSFVLMVRVSRDDDYLSVLAGEAAQSDRSRRTERRRPVPPQAAALLRPVLAQQVDHIANLLDSVIRERIWIEVHQVIPDDANLVQAFAKHLAVERPAELIP